VRKDPPRRAAASHVDDGGLACARLEPLRGAGGHDDVDSAAGCGSEQVPVARSIRGDDVLNPINRDSQSAVVSGFARRLPALYAAANP